MRAVVFEFDALLTLTLAIFLISQTFIILSQQSPKANLSELASSILRSMEKNGLLESGSLADINSFVASCLPKGLDFNLQIGGESVGSPIPPQDVWASSVIVYRGGSFVKVRLALWRKRS